jgi:hypothetical protein
VDRINRIIKIKNEEASRINLILLFYLGNPVNPVHSFDVSLAAQAG